MKMTSRGRFIVGFGVTCSIFVFNLDFSPYLQMTDLQINYLANYAEALANGAAQLIAFYINTFTPTEAWYIDIVYKCIISFILLWIVKRFHKIHSVGLIVKWFALQIIVFFTWVSSFHELTGQIHPLNVFVLLCLLAWIFTTVEDPSVSKPPTTHDEQPEVESGQWDYANANANLSVGVKKNKKRRGRGRRSKSKIRQKIQVGHTSINCALQSHKLTPPPHTLLTHSKQHDTSRNIHRTRRHRRSIRMLLGNKNIEPTKNS